MNETDIGDGFRLEDQLLRHRLGPDIEQATLTFIDTHDTDRFLTRVKNLEKYKSALELLLLGEEPALCYYGTELALTSGKATSRFDMSWPDRLPIPQTLVASDITEWIRQLIKQRKKRQKGVLITG
ncbi:MAG: Alpha amylase, catalytic domain [Candidatus Electronema aureum]|uniref:Alpha amylase, catalytic domain n=1 Tax=Candidatus Electronema aureum TaxID=2005002 RepID=A0A521G117_9BACT|nr:MAG: Alpha amylase, catalytic domain [Candidatus Electronema aureum]